MNEGQSWGLGVYQGMHSGMLQMDCKVDIPLGLVAEVQGLTLSFITSETACQLTEAGSISEKDLTKHEFKETDG